MIPSVEVRAACDVNDWLFIRSAWHATYLSGGPAVQGADRDYFRGEMSRFLAALAPVVEARIAEDRGERLGFVVFEGEALWFAYVLGDFRRMGLVPMMLAGLKITRYNQITLQGERRMRPRGQGWRYTPCLVLGTPS